MQLTAAAAKCCRIHACRGHVLAWYLAESRIRRRRNRVAEAGVRNCATNLRRRLAKRDVLERANVLALLDGQVRAEQQRRDDLVLHRLAVNLATDQLRQHARALRVTDEHDAAAAVV